MSVSPPAYKSEYIYTLVVHNAALYRLGGAQDDFACLLSIFSAGVQCSVVTLSVCPSTDRLTFGLDFWHEDRP